MSGVSAKSATHRPRRKMLCACSNRKQSAIGIFGDYYDLREVYTFVSHVASGSALPEQMRDFLWNFSYELRKAFEGRREIKKRGSDWLDKANYRGVYIYWPYYIVHLKLLRQASARRPTNRMEQGIMWMLEGLCEATLVKHAPETAARVLHWLDHSFTFNDSYLPEWLTVNCRRYLQSRGRKRLPGLAEFVSRISPVSREYQHFHSAMEEEARRQRRPIYELTDETPWPAAELL